MPRTRRRRHRSLAKRGWGRVLFLTLLVGFGSVLVIGSLVEIHTQSSQFRTSTNTGYGALASRVVDASNQTGAQLAVLMDSAPQLTNQSILRTQILESARVVLQHGLDQAVTSTSLEATQAAHLVPPPPVGNVSNRFTQVLTDRATAASDIRTGIDQLLGMTPLPIAGAPSSPVSSTPAPLTSIGQAGSTLAAAGLLFQQADNSYGALTVDLHRMGIPIHLPKSVWVPSPVDAAPLGSTRLGGSASLLDASAALRPFHQLVFTAVGLVPAAVSSGGPGTAGLGCRNPESVAPLPGAAPTVLPPTASVTAAATVTNCGTVAESGVVVTETLALADPPGTAPPPPTDNGGTSQGVVSLRSGMSTALSLRPLAVAGGHRYTLTLAIAVPTNQASPLGSTQQFLIQIST